MSRIYDNQPLQNLPLVNIETKGKWEQSKLKCGNGVLFEGCIQKRSHFMICDSDKKKYPYFVLFIKMTKAHRRIFDDSGKEVEPNFSETKKVSTGFLNSSYKVEARGTTDRLDIQQALDIINKPEMAEYTSKYGSSGHAAIWLSEEQLQGLEFESGDNVRVKTHGDGPFVFSICKLDEALSKVSNYAGGESVGASWTDKIMDMKSDVPSSKQAEGVDDDEWDD